MLWQISYNLHKILHVMDTGIRESVSRTMILKAIPRLKKICDAAFDQTSVKLSFQLVEYMVFMSARIDPLCAGSEREQYA